MAAVVNYLLKNVYMPTFSIGLDWTKNKLNAEENRNACLDSFKHFIEYIEATEENYKHIVKFQDNGRIDISGVKTFEDCQKFAIFDEKVLLVEQLMADWIRVIQEVIAESGQIRMEADNVGPLHELRYWQYILCRLSSVADFVQSDKFNTVIKILTAAQSRILKLWAEQDRTLTNKINEARDNVKYLQQLEKICQKFYENDMVCILIAFLN
ncbi:dynein axonemal heavy chain 5-like [Argiope bruennichi]|uniref:dynein axonemal heavy chain 5-like n=1 Tax=Argiope bruennichi TaxID=94029 RepID=UPI0024950CEF|nr:dynein axonemal heavy chain 5-like [Argiope bruennichi]